MRRWRWALVALIVVAGTFVTLGMTSPRTVPRLAFLPAPAPRELPDECETWRRQGLFWDTLYWGPRAGRPCKNW
jgi:hypothetical protein